MSETPKGRTPSPEMQGVRDRVLDTIKEHGAMSTPRVAEIVEASVDVVRRALWYYEKQGVIVRSSGKVIPPGGGRPAIIWELVENKG